jgi:predicted esterase
VAIGHGIQDPVISVEFARDARRRLEAAGVQVLYRESRMFHGIDPVFVQVLQNWLADLTHDVAAVEPGS